MNKCDVKTSRTRPGRVVSVERLERATETTTYDRSLQTSPMSPSTNVQISRQTVGPDNLNSFKVGNIRSRNTDVEGLKMQLADGRVKYQSEFGIVEGTGLGRGQGLGRPDDGIGPGLSGDQYLPIVENSFKEVKNEPLSDIFN